MAASASRVMAPLKLVGSRCAWTLKTRIAVATVACESPCQVGKAALAESLDWLIIQNTNAYEVGFTAAWDGFRGALWKNRTPETEKPLAGFLTHDAIKGIYLHGAKSPDLMSPDNWESDSAFMQRPHAVRMNLDLFYDYRTNVPLYPKWQAFLRERQPKTIIFWGQEDVFFTKEGGEANLKDLPNAEMHRLVGGHFAVEDNLEYVSDNIHRFYADKVAAGTMKTVGMRMK